MPAATPVPAPGPGLAALGSFALAALLLLLVPTPSREANAVATAPAPDAVLARLQEVEAALARIGAASSARDDALERRIDAAATAPAERFIAAALLLQSAVATSRPWLREYETMARLAPAGALAEPLAEVLLSHAARGLPTVAELRERFVALQPDLLARLPRQEGLLHQAVATVQSAAAGMGLAAPPVATDQEIAIGNVARHLQRGNLAAALADAAALDAAVQPLIAGWLAQAGARLAVEQAVRETLLRMLSAPETRG